MAMATTFVRAFPSLSALQVFIQTDATIVTIRSVFQDNSGQYILIYATV